MSTVHEQAQSDATYSVTHEGTRLTKHIDGQALSPSSHPLLYMSNHPGFDGSPAIELTKRVLELCQQYTMQPRTPVRCLDGIFYPHHDTDTYRWLSDNAEEIKREAQSIVYNCLSFDNDPLMCEEHDEDQPSPKCAYEHANFMLGTANVSNTQLPDGVDRVHVRVALLEAVVGWMLAEHFFANTCKADDADGS